MKHKSKKKKSYNPLKMWGTYVGIVIKGFMGFSIASLCRIGGNCSFLTYFIFIALGIISGFLIGWGLHSLSKKLVEVFDEMLEHNKGSLAGASIFLVASIVFTVTGIITGDYLHYVRAFIIALGAVALIWLSGRKVMKKVECKKKKTVGKK